MGRPELNTKQTTEGEFFSFRLAHVGNQRVVDFLDIFRKEGMKGPRAAFSLLSLIEPIPTEKDDMDLIRSGETKPETLWEQVGWAYAKPKELNEKQKESLISLQYFVLESLANSSQVRRVGGGTRDLSNKARQMAQKTFDEYNKYLVDALTDNNKPTKDKKKTAANINVGRTARTVLPTLFLGFNMLAPIPLLANLSNTQSVSEQSPSLNTYPDNSSYPIGPYVGDGKLFFQVAHVQWDWNEQTHRWHIYSTVKPGELGYWYSDGNCRTCGNIAGYYQQPAPPGTLIYTNYPPGVVIDGQTGYSVPAPPGTILYYPIK